MFIAVTVAVFIAEHIFAITLLAAAAAAVALLVRHQQRRTLRQRFPAAQPPHYPASLAQAPHTRAPIPQFATHGMSSAALRSRAHRSLPPSGRRSYP